MKEHTMRCHCKLMTLIRKCKKQNQNYGREFLCCRKNYQDPTKCNFFKWNDTKQQQQEEERKQQQQKTHSPKTTTTTKTTNWMNNMTKKNNNSSRETKKPVCAKHKIECIIKIVRKEGRNQGRQFYTCPAEYGCFFAWKTDWETRMNKHGATQIVNSDTQHDKRTVEDILGEKDNNKKNMTIEIEAEMVGTKENKQIILSKIPYGAIGYKLKQLIQMIEGKQETEKKREYSIPAERLSIFKKEAKKINDQITVRNIPENLEKLIDTFETIKTLEEKDIDMTLMPMRLYRILKPFQKAGTIYGIRRKGRFLLADEMGLGKTLQAMCVGTYYRKEWPMLIIAPSSLCGNWAAEIEKWLRYDIHSDNIIMLNTSKINIPSGDKTNMIFIISYTLAVNRIVELKAIGFSVIICDESHKLKNYDTQRAKALIPLIKSAKRKILITGTPVLSRPKELYTTLDILLGQTRGWMSFWEYAGHYCDRTIQTYGVDNDGASHLKELHFLLTQTIMIRRLKANVLQDMPPKIRKQVRVDITPTMQSKIKKIMDANKELLAKLEEAEREEDISDAHFKKNKDYMTLFKLSGMAKLPAIKHYLLNELQSHQDKFIFFAHHQAVLDAAEKVIKDYFHRHQQHTGTRGYVRIDGKTPKTKRLDMVKRFRETLECRVAILSINACNVGLTFSPQCFRIIFGELYFTPGSLQQAEDRIHRINQPNTCLIHYILGRHTLDTRLWPMILRKLTILSESLEGKQQSMEAWNANKEKFQATEALDDIVMEDIQQTTALLTKDKVRDLFTANEAMIKAQHVQSREEKLQAIQNTLTFERDWLPPSIRAFPKMLSSTEQDIEFYDSEDDVEEPPKKKKKISVSPPKKMSPIMLDEEFSPINLMSNETLKKKSMSPINLDSPDHMSDHLPDFWSDQKQKLLHDVNEALKGPYLIPSHLWSST
mmetsp:Transcript_11209/g.16558  ORF Transcript_11209/g.16558 Transcript_11209/m.16558 type:complete len:938 (-) Transcript_11209:1619-4432(-)